MEVLEGVCAALLIRMSADCVVDTCPFLQTATSDLAVCSTHMAASSEQVVACLAAYLHVSNTP